MFHGRIATACFINYRTYFVLFSRFKLAVLKFKVRTVSMPSYLSRHITSRGNVRTLRSSTVAVLSELFFSTAFAKRACRCSAPATWNSLPRTITDSDALGTFKSRLKTFLFCQTFN